MVSSWLYRLARNPESTMKTNHLRPASSRPSTRSSFTLIKHLMVVAIIAILVGIVIGIAGYSSKKSATAKALSDLERIKTALEEYRMEKGGYINVTIATNTPPTDPAFISFTNTLAKYVPNLTCIDPWGRPYPYTPNKLPNQPVLVYRLWSQGALTTTTDDDVDSTGGKY